MYHDELDGTGEFSHSQIDEYIKSGASTTSAVSPPNTGTWALGDIVWNADPSPGDYVGWVCTFAGTPGFWNGFGEIEA